MRFPVEIVWSGAMPRLDGAEPRPHTTQPLALLRTVPMRDLHFVSRFPQPLADIFGDHHRAVLSAGTSEADGQVALSLANVVRQQVDQQFRDAVNELLRLRERSDVFGDPRMPSRPPTKLRHEMRIV